MELDVAFTSWAPAGAKRRVNAMGVRDGLSKRINEDQGKASRGMGLETRSREKRATSASAVTGGASNIVTA